MDTPESPGYESEMLSSTKIEPLDSPNKPKASHESVIGEDYIIVSSHIAPFEPVEGHKMGVSQLGGHHNSHHKRRDSHAEKDLQRSLESHPESKSNPTNDNPNVQTKDTDNNNRGYGKERDSSMSTAGLGLGKGTETKHDLEQDMGMRMGEKLSEHGKGGMEMRRDL